MLQTYTYPHYAYRSPAELGAAGLARHPLVIIGGGPVGLCAAIDCAQLGLPVVLLDDDHTVSVGSRGLCYAKRTLEVLDRLGCGDAVVGRGVTWNVGRTFYRGAEVFRFDLLSEAGHHRPGMVNLQQYHLEEALVTRAGELPAIDLRWQSKAVVVTPRGDGVLVEVETPEGRYTLHADWVIVADGARSTVRRQLGLDVQGRVFQDRFLIADVVMKTELFPAGAAERWFWFDPPFHPGQSVLLHREADNVWRIDFQLGADADVDAEKQPERVISRIRAMLGQHHAFELEWVSVYTFQCRRMARFRHGRLLFVGDAAHQVSPFGARGANSGIQDVDNLGWKLKLVVAGLAPETLLDSYSDERVAAADENLLNSTRSTDFISPKTQVSHDFRNAVLTLAGEHAFARMLVNSGRLSVPAQHAGSALNTGDADGFGGLMAPGSAIDDAPVRFHGDDGWLLAHTGGRFVLMLFIDDAVGLAPELLQALASLATDAIAVSTLLVAQRPGPMPSGLTMVVDHMGLVAQRFDARPGSAYLLRPDQHVAARWRRFDAAAVRAAVARATCNA